MPNRGSSHARCGMEFTVPEDELSLQSVPKDWLLAKVHAA